DPGQQLDIKVPRRCPVRVLRAKLAFEKAEFDLEAGKAPFLKKISPFHSKDLHLELASVKPAATKLVYHKIPHALPRHARESGHPGVGGHGACRSGPPLPRG